MEMVEVLLIRDGRVAYMTDDISLRYFGTDLDVIGDIREMGIDPDVAGECLQVDGIATVSVEIFLLLELRIPIMEIVHLAPGEISLHG